jgi:hypothetical protein
MGRATEVKHYHTLVSNPVPTIVPGVYLGPSGVLSRVADSSTLIPGGTGTFTSFGAPLVADGGGSTAKPSPPRR